MRHIHGRGSRKTEWGRHHGRPKKVCGHTDPDKYTLIEYTVERDKNRHAKYTIMYTVFHKKRPGT